MIAHKLFFFNCTGEIHQDRPYSEPKRNLSKLKRIEMMQSMFTGHNKIKLKLIPERYWENLKILGNYKTLSK